jgi:nucleoside-diphosphate-sugar epimerase
LARQLSTANGYDSTETRRDLGWEPVVSMDQGLERLRRAVR